MKPLASDLHLLHTPQYDKSKLKLIGEDVFISANVEIRRPRLVSIGKHVAIDSGVYITTQAEIGDYIHIGPYVTVIGGQHGLLKMKNFTNIAVGSRIICASDGFLGDGLVTAPGIPSQFQDNIKIEPIIFENFANVGANVVILPGVILAEGSVIGANSLVIENTEPWTIYFGSPARPKKMRKKEDMIKYARLLGYQL